MEAFEEEQLTSQEKETRVVTLTERKENGRFRKVAFWVTLSMAFLFSLLFILYGFYFTIYFTESTESNGKIVLLGILAAFPLSLLLALPRFYGSLSERQSFTVGQVFLKELLDLLREYLNKKL